MEENKKTNEEIKTKFTESTEKLKNGTIKAAQKIKSTVKDAQIKEETKKTKGFIIEMIKDPFEKIKEVSNDEGKKYFKTSIFLIIIWILAEFIYSTYSAIYFAGFTRPFNNILNVLKTIVTPILEILVYSFIVLLYNSKNKKTFSTVFATVTVTHLPIIIASVISILTIFNPKISLITKPFSELCTTLSIVLGFIGFKFLYNEEYKNFIKKYVLIQTMYYVFSIIIGLFGIYI